MFYSLEFANSNSFLNAQDLNLARPVREAKKSSERWPGSNWNHEVSTVAAIFGANASGKSGLVRSLWLAVKNATRDDQIAVSPFRLEREADGQPVYFDLRFEASNFASVEEKCEYQYRFETSPSGVVLLEELRFYPNKGGKSQRVFRREIGENWLAEGEHKTPEYRYRWGDKFKGEKAFVVRMTNPDELFLANTYLLPENPLAPVLDWLDNRVHFYSATGYQVEFSRIKSRLYEDPELLKKVVGYVRQADLGIVDLKVIARSEEEVASYRRSLENEGFAKGAIDRAVKDFALELSFTHASEDGSFDFNEHFESDGTRAMLSFASIAIDALENGSLIVIDEIDTSLHPLLVRELIRQFTSPETNPHQAQLIFTTHDVTLLHNPSWMEPVLERDQIWLVEKDLNGASNLYSIAEFPQRSDENIFRKYMAGQYGSVPHPHLTLHAGIKAS